MRLSDNADFSGGPVEVHPSARLLPLIALAALLAGCGERRWSVAHVPTLGWQRAGTPHLPMRIAPDLVIKRVQFGLVETGADGEEHFTATQDLPPDDGQAFGWVIEFDTTRASVRWQERLRLPREPAEWGDAASDPDVTLSSDGVSAMAQGEDLVEDGEVSRFYWSLAAGDPPGDYEIDLAVEGRPVAHYVFKVAAPVKEKAILVQNRAGRSSRLIAHIVPVMNGSGAMPWR
jgi:hypothetical protein